MQRNEKKKLTIIDHWTKFYTKGASLRQKRSDKKRTKSEMRNYNKKLCQEDSD